MNRIRGHTMEGLRGDSQSPQFILPPGDLHNRTHWHGLAQVFSKCIKSMIVFGYSQLASCSLSAFNKTPDRSVSNSSLDAGFKRSCPSTWFVSQLSSQLCLLTAKIDIIMKRAHEFTEAAQRRHLMSPLCPHTALWKCSTNLGANCYWKFIIFVYTCPRPISFNYSMYIIKFI